MTITVTPIDATLGAIVTNVDLANLNEDEWSDIHAAFLKYGLLVFPKQKLDEQAQGAFALRLGNIEQLSPEQKGGTIEFTNRKEDGSIATPDEERYKLMKGNEGWHTDSTYMPVASKAAMLYALVVPPDGGETEYADMRAAWDALDEETQAKLGKLSAHHSLYYSQEQAGFKHNTDQVYGFHDKGTPLRPIVKTHPETGRKSIYTGRHAHNIPGMSQAESKALLEKLMADACQPPRVYKHSWKVGDLVVWDNRCLMHRACPFDMSQPRVLRASRISGAPETELAPTVADPRAADYHETTSNKSALVS
ncbi:MAG: TauD/TfdA family dioxygenase [Betaproteobacteria bacterium]|nr:MAG: TauD/TfdA family dioxygenase [Betaproteobacteria bacterium]